MNKTKERPIHNFLSVYWKHCKKINVFVSWMMSELDASLNKIKYTRHTAGIYSLSLRVLTDLEVSLVVKMDQVGLNLFVS